MIREDGSGSSIYKQTHRCKICSHNYRKPCKPTVWDSKMHHLESTVKRTITVLSKFRFPSVRGPYPRLICWVLRTDESELWKPQRTNKTMYKMCRVLWKPTERLWVDSFMLSWLFCCVLLTPCRTVCLLSCLVHRCSLSPHRDAGDLCCVIRESQAGSCSSSTQDHLLCQWQTHIYCAAKKNKQKTVLLGSREQRFAKYVFQWFLWISAIVFLRCPTSSCDFLWLLDSAVPPLQPAEESPFPIVKSRLQWTPLKAILILKD